MSTPTYLKLVEHYTSCFRMHGPTAKGVDWPNSADVQKRFAVMVGVIPPDQLLDGCSIIDLGCGYGALWEYVTAHHPRVSYKGIDLSEPLISAARARHPNVSFELRDVLERPLEEACTDYVIMNGLFTVR